MEPIYQLAQKGSVGKLPTDLPAMACHDIFSEMGVSLFTIDESGEEETVVVFRSAEDLSDFESRSGVRLENPSLVMTGPEAPPKKKRSIGMATEQNPAVAAFLDFRSKPSSTSSYRVPCNSHTRPAVLALGVVPTIFEDVRDTACVLRSLHVGIEIFNAVLCLWKSAGSYPWEKDLNEAREWLLRADAVLVSRQEDTARPMIANAIAEIDKLRLGNYGKTEG